MKKILKDLIKGSAHILYHVVVVSLSAAIALSLPYTAAFIKEKFQVYWLLIETQQVFLVSVEIGVAVLLILSFNLIARIWKDKRLSGMAKSAGLVFVASNKGFFARRRIRRLKTQQGFARDIMFIGSTGCRTFVDPNGELYDVVQNCRDARIMLLCPWSKGATTRAKGILSPDITPECLAAKIRKSIEYLKELKGMQKNIKLKLYQDSPFLKLSILADYAWVQHYHLGIDVEMMPKYVFRYNQNPKSLYVPFYQYFLARWDDPKIPEYDFDSDELVYRDLAGNEVRREKPEWIEAEVPPAESPYGQMNPQQLLLQEFQMPFAGSV